MGGCSKEIVSEIEKHCTHFYIRANRCSSLYDDLFALLHIDFYEVNDQKPITIGIPVKLNGLAQGVRDGGRINLSIRKINVTAPYQVIPEHLDIDVTNLQLGKSIKVGDLSFEGLTLSTPAEVVVCSVKATRASRSAAAAAAQG